MGPRVLEVMRPMRGVSSKGVRFLCLFLLFLLVGTPYSAFAKSTADIEASWQSMRPHRARVLLLIPQEFGEFGYIFAYKGRDIELPLGDQATDQLQLLLQSAFTSLETMPVASEVEAKAMVAEEDPNLQDFDLVAIPKFLNVSSWDSGPGFGFNVDLSLEITSFDKKTVDTIKGHGEASTPEGGYSPIERLSLAVSYALDAIKDGIETGGDSASSR
jgi:hypothetical protein